MWRWLTGLGLLLVLGLALVLSAGPSYQHNMLIRLASFWYGWASPAEPAHIAGPVYFVGSAGLGVYLLTSEQGHVLLNTGLPGSAKQIVKSVKQLGFDPSDIRWLIFNHAHIDHAGDAAYFQQRFGVKIALMQDEVALLEAGGRGDFHYAQHLAYKPAQVDRVLHDGDVLSLGRLQLKALHTPGHTPGATSWQLGFIEQGREYNLLFVEGVGVNPGYQLWSNPNYWQIAHDYQRSFTVLASLRPDIWLSGHTEQFNLLGKLERARELGIGAWLDLEGYQAFIAKQQAHFERRYRQQADGG